MTRLTKNQLRDRRIFNEWYLAKLQDEPKVYLQYFPATNGTLAEYARWSIQEHGVNHEVGGTSVPRPREQKENLRISLLDRMSVKFGISGWERSPFGSYHPVGTMARAKALEAK